MATEKDPGMIRCIALFKLFKALGLLGVMATSFNLIRHEPTEVVTRWALAVHVDPGNYYVQSLLAWLLRIDVKQLELFAVGTGLYALLFAVEGVGLWLAKTWAENLTCVTTAGFLPVELYELSKKASLTKWGLLLLNLAIVIYLVRRGSRRSQTPTAGRPHERRDR